MALRRRRRRSRVHGEHVDLAEPDPPVDGHAHRARLEVGERRAVFERPLGHPRTERAAVPVAAMLCRRRHRVDPHILAAPHRLRGADGTVGDPRHSGREAGVLRQRRDVHRPEQAIGSAEPGLQDPPGFVQAALVGDHAKARGPRPIPSRAPTASSAISGIRSSRISPRPGAAASIDGLRPSRTRIGAGRRSASRLSTAAMTSVAGGSPMTQIAFRIGTGHDRRPGDRERLPLGPRPTRTSASGNARIAVKSACQARSRSSVPAMVRRLRGPQRTRASRARRTPRTCTSRPSVG